MTVEKRVLFLAANAGTGHISAAEAVSKALTTLDPHIKARIIDSYTQASVLLGKVAQGYVQLVKFLPQLYSFFYELRERESANLLKAVLTQLTVRKFRTLIREFKPHILICTHAFPSGAASLLKKEFGFPVVNIITDFTVHPFWIHPDTDLYLVGDQGLRLDLESHGIPSERIRVTGIPVDPRFSEKRGKEEAQREIGLVPGLCTVLLMGGGAGIGPIGWILRSLRKVRHAMQVVVVTGVNRGLRKRIEGYAVRMNGRRGKKSLIRHVKVFGFVENIHEIMSASDLLITKPGGLTSSEALAAELPIVIVRPLPGQEIRNAQYLVREKAALMVKRVGSVARTVDQLLGDPERLARLQDRARLLKKPNSAFEAARCVLELMRG